MKRDTSRLVRRFREIPELVCVLLLRPLDSSSLRSAELLFIRIV